MVKFALEQAMKAQMGSRGIALLFLSHLVVYMFMRNKNKLHQSFIFILHSSTLITLRNRWVWVVNTTPQPLYPQERPGTQCI